MQDRIGKFQVIRQLGKGAMGEVYLARDTVLDREVAIKTILAGSAFGNEARARFEREARVTGTMNHPHIVTVYEFGESEGMHYLVMEYVEGENLEGIIHKGSLDKVQLLEVLAQVCDALAFAHEHGVIHRDIKPANVLVGFRGRKIQAKLMDFGVALVDRSNLTQGGVWMGTVNYMAPEYLDTGKATSSSDLFAVGVMLYEILTGGRKPFFGDTTTSVLNAILRSSPAPISPEEVRGLDPEVLSVVKRALAKDPGERFPSAEALAVAIRGIERREEALAAPAHPTVAIGASALPPKPPAREPSDRLLVVGKGPRATCLSLRVALRQAEPGNQILILPGHYRESLVIDKAVTLQGDGEPGSVVLEAPSGPLALVQAPGVTFEGLTLRRSPSEVSGQELVGVQGGQLTLRSCRVEAGAGLAVRIAGAGSGLVLAGGEVSGDGELGLIGDNGAVIQAEGAELRGFGRAAVAVRSGAHATLRGCRIGSGTGVGVWVCGSGQVTLEDCEVNDRTAGGIEAEEEARVNARRCQIAGSRFAGVLALPRAQISLDDVVLSGHGAAGCHALGASLQFRQVQLERNQGFGLSLLDGSLVSMEQCGLSQNGAPGLFIHQGATAQLKNSKLFDGASLGVVCTTGGRAVLESCEIYGNAQTGAQVEPGGSLLLVRCVLRDGRDSGLLLFEDAEVTLEECAVHRNARGGILLTKDASDPVIRGAAKIEDDLLRATPTGGLVKLAPLKR